MCENKFTQPEHTHTNRYFYLPQRSWAKVMFLLTGGVSASVHAEIHTPPPQQTPPGADTPRSKHPLGADTPRSRHPWSRHPPSKSRLRHTVNERPVRILLECMLVQHSILGCVYNERPVRILLEYMLVQHSILGCVYNKCQCQHCDDVSNTILIENNGVTEESVVTPIWSECIVFSENSITSVITELSQHWRW